MAGHHLRAASKDAKKYDNPLTDYMNLVIAQAKADASIKELEKKLKSD